MQRCRRLCVSRLSHEMATLPFCPRNCRFQEWGFTSLVPIFGGPHSSPGIHNKIEREMIISKFWIRNVTRILPTENYFIPKCFTKQSFHLSKCREVLQVLSLSAQEWTNPWPCRPTLWDKLGQVELGQTPSWA